MFQESKRGKLEESDYKRAAALFTAGRTQAVFHKPIYSPIIFGMNPVVDEHLPTMATDGKSLFYGPKFMLDTPPAHIKFGILHEGLHCALRHPKRRGTRDPEIWNRASDLIVNGILVYGEGMSEYPEWIILDKKYWQKNDGTYWSVEEVYDDLMKDPENSKKKYKLVCSCVRNGPKGEDGGGGEKGDKDEQGGGGCKHGDGDPTGKGWDIPWDAEMEDKWKGALIASEQIAKIRGTAPGWLTSAVAELAEPPVPIEKLLLHIVGSLGSDETSWKSPNRRFVSRGVHLPSTLKDKKDGVFVADTSGSISDEEAKDFLGIALRAVRSKGINELRVMQCDADIADDQKVSVRNVAQFKVHVKQKGIQGRGGTSFIPPFERIEKEGGWKTSFLVYLTDLQGSFPTKRPRFPVIWISTTNQKAPFGRTFFWQRENNTLQPVK